MLRMRLTRVGSKKRPAYRVVVADSRAPRDGRHVDIVGHYNPMTKPSTVNIDVDRAVKWLRNGAQPSERVRILLRHSGVLKAHEEARLADKRQRKEAADAAPVRAAKKAAGEVADVARTAFKVIVRGATKAADVVADAAEAVADAVPARRSRPRAGTGAAGKSSSKTAAKKASAKTSAAAKKSAAKSTTAAKSAERAAARKSAAKAAKSE